MRTRLRRDVWAEAAVSTISAAETSMLICFASSIEQPNQPQHVYPRKFSAFPFGNYFLSTIVGAVDNAAYSESERSVQSSLPKRSRIDCPGPVELGRKVPPHALFLFLFQPVTDGLSSQPNLKDQSLKPVLHNAKVAWRFYEKTNN